MLTCKDCTREFPFSLTSSLFWPKEVISIEDGEGSSTFFSVCHCHFLPYQVYGITSGFLRLQACSLSFSHTHLASGPRGTFMNPCSHPQWENSLLPGQSGFCSLCPQSSQPITAAWFRRPGSHQSLCSANIKRYISERQFNLLSSGLRRKTYLLPSPMGTGNSWDTNILTHSPKKFLFPN